MTDTSTIIGVLILAYLLGSIPFGLLFSRMGGLGDIRETGSGNIGATNVLRSGNKLLAALTLLTDAAKGSIAIFIALEFVGFPTAYWAGLAALLGHIFPVWLGFKGGKGVAVFIGSSIVLSPLPGLSMLSVWLLVALISRRSSLAALVATLSVPALYVCSRRSIRCCGGRRSGWRHLLGASREYFASAKRTGTAHRAVCVNSFKL